MPALLTKEIERTLPPIRSGDNVARVKYFTPWSDWNRYAGEASAELEDGSEVPLSNPRPPTPLGIGAITSAAGLKARAGLAVR